MDFFYHFLFRGKIRFNVGPNFGFLPLKPTRINPPANAFSWPKQEGLLRYENRPGMALFLRLAEFSQRGRARFKG